MKEILIVSGKGGSGKTSLSACFAQLAGNSVLVDCDVDASDLHLLLHPKNSETHDFVAGELPKVNGNRCVSCGCCISLCRFDAIHWGRNGAEVAATGCEGCGVCVDHCPVQAISMKPRHCGFWMRSETACGPMFHARLLPGGENSGKLVAELRKAAREEAEARHCDWLLSDGPPGIGCPVISASTGVDYAVVITEPTVSGIHDMQRLGQLLHQFEVPFGVVVNKFDLSSEGTAALEGWCDEHHIEVLGKIPFDPVFPRQLRKGKTVLDAEDNQPAQMIKNLWHGLSARLTKGD